jgi:hypothetical protein
MVVDLLAGMIMVVYLLTVMIMVKTYLQA